MRLSMTHRKRVKEHHKQEIKCQGPLYVLNGGADFPLKENRERQQTRRRGTNKERGRENEQDEDRLGSRKSITTSCSRFLLYIKLKLTSCNGHHNT